MKVEMPILPGNKPSKVIKINVLVDTEVKCDQELITVESSKGNRIIKSPVDGIVGSIAVREGDLVVGNQLLFEIQEKVEENVIDVEMPILPGNKESKVIKINVLVDTEVKCDQELITVESTKGNRIIKSPVDGIIKKISVTEGQCVIGKQILIQISQNISVENKENNSDLVIIGGGPGGYVAAIYAAKKGKKVTLIEKNRLGGTCLNVGCIPTKSMIKSSEVYDHIMNSEEFGLEKISPYQINLSKVVERKNKVVDTLVGGIEALMDQNNITVINGHAKFIDNHSVEVNSQTINFNDCIIATGTKIKRPNIKGIDCDFVLDSTQCLDLKKLPKTLAVIGGGVIGMEFAFLMQGFGVDVTVIEYADHLLGNTDSKAVETIMGIATKKGIKIHLSSSVYECIENEVGGIVKFKKGDKDLAVECQNALLAFGRVSVIDDIDLDKANIALTQRKNAIKVNDMMATNIKNIYAIGDVNGLIQLAHAASHQGIIAVNNILGHHEKFNIDMVPSVIFTAPEIATVGITKDLAKERNIKYNAGIFHFASNGKAQAMGEPIGHIELISNESDVIIGGTIIGPDAGSLIATVTLAIQNKMKVSAITNTIFAHPTTAEAIHEAAMGLGLGCLHE